MKLDDVKNLLDRGDYVKIARIASTENRKTNRQYVYKVMSGKIKAKRGLGKRIFEVAKHIARVNADGGKLPENC